MRRDVKLLGRLLGDVISESGPHGPDLLDDVERLRHAVIEARREPADEQIAELVGSWDLDRAEQVANAFTVYFHLVNLAEEHQRIRILRERDTGDALVRESLAAAVTELGPDAVDDFTVHLVLTAHPTEARRRAVVAALRRVSDLLGTVNRQDLGAS